MEYVSSDPPVLQNPFHCFSTFAFRICSSLPNVSHGCVREFGTKRSFVQARARDIRVLSESRWYVKREDLFSCSPHRSPVISCFKDSPSEICGLRLKRFDDKESPVKHGGYRRHDGTGSVVAGVFRSIALVVLEFVATSTGCLDGETWPPIVSEVARLCSPDRTITTESRNLVKQLISFLRAFSGL